MNSAAPADAQPPVPVQVGPPELQEEAQTVAVAIQGIQGIQDPPAADTALQLPAAAEPDEDDEDQDDADDEQPGPSYYWDASTMAPLNATSAAAIARLGAYKPPPFPLWDRLPLSRRAAVLMLLYADRRGDLRVVITMRAANLRSFSGHAALPGGKADSLDETPYQIARREAWEEIGLPMDDAKIPPPFRIEHLCYLPMNLARTELVVRPCVAFLHTTDPPVPTGPVSASASASTSSPTPAPAKTTTTTTKTTKTTPTVEESLIPRLDAKEVAAVFSAPFHNFLRATDERQDGEPPLPPGKWYEGAWTTWHDEPWRMHFFYVPVTNQRVVKPRAPARRGSSSSSNRDRSGSSNRREVLAEDGNGNGNGNSGATTNNNDGNNGNGAAAAEKETKAAGTAEEVEEEGGRYKVWGMTARMLVDAATVAYGEPPEFEHNSHFGDERIIEALARMGRLGEKKRPGSVLTGEDLKQAKDNAAAAEGGKKGGAGAGGEPSKM